MTTIKQTDREDLLGHLNDITEALTLAEHEAHEAYAALPVTTDDGRHVDEAERHIAVLRELGRARMAAHCASGMLTERT